MKIAIHGKKQAGKDTIGDYLVKHYDFISLGFADPLKADLVSLGVPAAQLYNTKDLVYRQLMQVYGAAQRDSNIDHWVDRLLDTVDGLEHDFPDVDVVITDMRYWNEAETLRNEGYLLVKVECDDDDYEDAHASETDLEDWLDWDVVMVAKRGHIDDLYDQTDSAVTEWENEGI